MKDLFEYCKGNRAEAMMALVIVLILVACMVVMAVMYGWAGLALGLAIPSAAMAVARLTRSRRN